MTLLKPAGISAKPIPFTAPMVRALLDGRKTQTRRTLSSARVFRTHETPAFTLRGADLKRALQGAGDFRHFGDDMWTWHADAFEWQAPHTRTTWNAHLGHAPGDLLWVREAVRAGEDESNFDRQVEYLADGATRRVADCEDNSSEEFVRWWVLNSYRATDPDLDGGKIVSPRHMPRWASRLTLAVTDVRVQRLQEISEEDAIAEGVCVFAESLDRPGAWAKVEAQDRAGLVQALYGTNRAAYAHLWDNINGPGSWQENPWVVALTFTVHHCNVDQMAGALASLPATATSTGG